MSRIISFICMVSLSIIFVVTVFATDTKPTETKKPALGEIKTSGVIYINYIYDVDDLGKGKGFNRFDIDRTYLTFESAIADKVKMRVTTDIYQNAKVTSFKAEDGSKADNTDAKSIQIASYYDGWSVRLKNAYNVRAVLDLQQTSYQASDKNSTSQIMCQVEVKF